MRDLQLEKNRAELMTDALKVIKQEVAKNHPNSTEKEKQTEISKMRAAFMTGKLPRYH